MTEHLPDERRAAELEWNSGSDPAAKIAFTCPRTSSFHRCCSEGSSPVVTEMYLNPLSQLVDRSFLSRARWAIPWQLGIGKRLPNSSEYKRPAEKRTSFDRGDLDHSQVRRN